MEGLSIPPAAGPLIASLKRADAYPRDSLAAWELLMTDLFFSHVCQRLHGGGCRDTCSGPRVRAQAPGAAVLDSCRSSQTPGAILRGLSPHHPYYRRAVAMRHHVRELMAARRWGPFPVVDTLRPEGRRTLKRSVRGILSFWGDLPPRQTPTGYPDDLSVEAVRRFQARHGCPTTGTLDSATVAALRVSPEDRLRQIEANLDRWRRASRDLGDPHVLVNIPDYRLSVVEAGRVRLAMNVVVGLPAWPTPVFSSRITAVVFNPYWLSPPRILATELINYIRADSGYLRSNRMVILRGSGDRERVVDPRTIAWATIRPAEIDFQLRQDPGPQNIMGEVKFLSPNPYDVYLHDTPYREDFGRTTRLASHGCVRLERAFDFAAYLLRGARRWTPASIDSVRSTRVTTTVFLPEPLPVHVVYATAWLEDSGLMQFRPDPYQLDPLLPSAARTRSRGSSDSTHQRPAR